jgi:hypothetical protein
MEAERGSARHLPQRDNGCMPVMECVVSCPSVDGTSGCGSLRKRKQTTTWKSKENRKWSLMRPGTGPGNARWIAKDRPFPPLTDTSGPFWCFLFCNHAEPRTCKQRGIERANASLSFSSKESSVPGLPSRAGRALRKDRVQPNPSMLGNGAFVNVLPTIAPKFSSARNDAGPDRADPQLC